MSSLAEASPSDSWAFYWASPQRRVQGGCLSSASAAMEAALGAVWASVARALPARAGVLDLATGNGIVLAKLAARRTDLALTGVDSSAILPPAPPGVELLAGVAIEALPFPDARFDAVTSQFGIEYGDLAQAAGECGRVLKPSGRCTLLLHHAESRVVGHNRERARALRWAARESGYLGLAEQFLAGGRKGAVPAALRDAPLLARRLHAGQAVAEEFVQAIGQCLAAPAIVGARHLALLATRANHEIARIEALEEAACDAARIADLQAALRAAGIAGEPARLIHEADDDQPLAWLVEGVRVYTRDQQDRSCRAKSRHAPERGRGK